MIQLYVTGGTFDKDYNFLTGELSFKDTHLKEMLLRGRCTLEVDLKTLMMVDSLQMTEADREIIVHQCRACAVDKILLTHGTDTMTVTAAVLARANIPKTIVLVGAMIPYAFGMSSDGFFNLGSALAFVQTLPHGVYVVMNGRSFEWDKVRKNLQTGNFEAI
jgi:L-asparaginase